MSDHSSRPTTSTLTLSSRSFTFNKEGLITEKYDIQQPGEYKF